MNGDDKLLINEINDINKEGLVCPKCGEPVIYCKGETLTYFKHSNGHMGNCEYYIHGENNHIDHSDIDCNDEEAALCCIITTISCITCICCIPPLVLLLDWIDSE